MSYHEKIEDLGGASYDYDDAVDNQTGYFDYDDPRNYEEWCDWNDPDVVEGYYNPFRPDVEGLSFLGLFSEWTQKLLLLHRYCVERRVWIYPSQNKRTSIVILIQGPGSPFRGLRIY